MKTYEVLKAAFFGLKKGDFIKYHEGEVFKDGKHIADFDPSTESTFFKEIPNFEYKYKVDDKVRFKHSFMEYKIIRLSTKIIKGKVFPAYYLYGVNSPYLESDLILLEHYWFINTKGQVCQDVKGKISEYDNFRMKSDNFFLNKEDAISKRDEILKKVISFVK